MTENPQTKSMLQRIAWIGGALLTIMVITAAVSRKKQMTIAATVVDVQPLEGGAYLIDSADVIEIIGQSLGAPLDDQLAGDVDAGRVERVLEEDPFVRNAEVALTANSRIIIEVEQREPILRVRDKQGSQYYLDKTGTRVPLSKHFAARTLVATGNIPPHTPEFLKKKKSEMKDLFELTQFILADDLWRALFEQIYVNSRKEFVLVPKVGDQIVLLGRFENLEDKLRRLRVFYEKAVSYEGWQRYKSIDLRYRGQVVCEKR
jgi:cell division protein FtsQ